MLTRLAVALTALLVVAACSSSPTPTPVVVTATPTPTPAPAPTATPAPVVLTQADLPDWFEPVPPEELDLAPGSLIADVPNSPTIDASFAFASVEPFEVLYGFTYTVDSVLSRVAADAEIANPELSADVLVAAMGARPEGVVYYPDPRIGDLSTRVGVKVSFEGVPHTLQMIQFRRGDAVVLVASFTLTQWPTDTDLIQYARILDQRISPAPTTASSPAPAATPTLAPTAPPVVVTATPTPAPSPTPVVVTATPTPAPSPPPVVVTATPTPAPSPTPVVVTATPTPAPSPPPVVVTATPTPAPSPTPVVVTATPTPAPSPTPTPATLSPAQVFERVGPSVVLVENPDGSWGSGILLEDKHVVTNAHVVWPYERVRLIFPDGTRIDDVPVVGSDRLVDLAVIGPVDVPTGGVALVDGEGLPIGAEVFLIGYPGEYGADPQPTLTRGLLSRVREWEAPGLTWLQSDAPIAGGQSGGALVSARGEVIGLSGFSYTEADFSLAASSADLLPRVQQLVRGEDPGGLGDRSLPLRPGPRRAAILLPNFWAQAVYVFEPSPDSEIDFVLDGSSDGMLEVVDTYGQGLAWDENETGGEVGSVIIGSSVPHFLVVSHWSDRDGAFTLSTSHPILTPLHDPDDGKQLRPGDSVRGSLDFPGDVDYFTVRLRQNETIELGVQSVLVDPYVVVDYRGAYSDQIIVDDDSGGGVFGVDARIVYRAPHHGDFLVVVESAYGLEVGGYILTIETAAPGAVPTTTTL